MGYAERVGQGSIILFSANLLAFAAGYFFRVVYLSHALSVEDFGLFFSVLGFVGIFGLFKVLGFQDPLVKYIAEFYAKKEYGKIKSLVITASLIQFAVGALIFFPLIIVSPYLASHFFHTASASAVMGILFAELILNFTFLTPMFQGLQKFHVLAPMELVRVIVLILVVPQFVHLGAAGVAIGYFIAAMAVNVLFFVALIHYTPFLRRAKFSLDTKLIRTMAAFGLTIMAGTIASMIITRTDSLFLTYFRPLAEVGWYNVALPTASLLLIFTAPLVSTVFPVIAELWADKDEKRIAHGITTLVRLSFAFMVPVAFVLIAFSDLIVRTFSGPAYDGAIPVLQILSVGMVFAAGFQLLAAALTALGKPRAVTKIILIVLAVNVISNIILVPALGATGSALVTTVSYVLMFYLSQRALGSIVRIDARSVVKIFGCGLLTLLALIVLKAALVLDPIVEAIILVFAGGILYAFLAVKTRIVTRADAELLFSAIFVPPSIRKLARRVLKE